MFYTGGSLNEVKVEVNIFDLNTIRSNDSVRLNSKSESSYNSSLIADFKKKFSDKTPNIVLLASYAKEKNEV